jgi:potassium uptake TrkH family protein
MAQSRVQIELLHPARIIAIGFASVIAIGTLLLSLPFSTAGGAPRAPIITALFTSTSATCVTGLIVVDTATYWSTFGKFVIAILVQIGGLGIMAFGSMLAYAVSARIGLRLRMAAQTETSAMNLGDVRRLLRSVVIFVAGVEIVVAVVLTLRFWLSADEGFVDAVGLGAFHAVSAFNNAGFSLFGDNLVAFVTDAWVVVPIAVAIVIGVLGFPVLAEMRQSALRPGTWSLHTKLTLATTAVLLAVGFAAFLALEWSNPATLAPLDGADKALAAGFQSVTPRTAGFNTLNYADMHQSTWLLTSVLMFIGGGSASTAGGIKVTTFALLGFVMWSELRGSGDVTIFRRRAATASQRQALTVALLSIGVVIAATLALVTISGLPLGQVLFESISAFALVGLSTGITDRLDDLGQVLLIVLMFVGRIGPATMGIALVLRERDRRFRYPEDRPLIG